MPNDPNLNDAPKDPRIGTLLAGRYLILDELARGGMARIYRAEQKPLGRIVAVKVLLNLHNQEDNDPRFQERFFLEASTLSKLKHGNTVTVFDYGTDDEGQYYMVMEYVEGRTLKDVVRADGGVLHAARVVHYTIEILRSLQEAHELGVVHRDLKPGNIMLVDSHEGEVLKVLDFGIAKVMGDGDDGSNLTMDDRIVGSPRYMAPEQIRHQPVDPRTDLYALGVMMFEMLTGVPPFRGDSAMATLLSHINDPVPDVELVAQRDLPPALVELITACLQKDMSQRPDSAEVLRKALRAVLTEIADSSSTVSRLQTQSLVRRALKTEEAPMNTDPTLNRPMVEPDTTTSSSKAIVGVSLFMVLLGIGGVALLGVGVAGYLVYASSPASEDSRPPPATTVQVNQVMVRSTPDGATVKTLDGEVLGQTPLAIPLDGGDRVVVLTAEGYKPRQHTLRDLGADTEVQLVLEADAAPVEPPAEEPPAPSPKRPTPKKSEDLDLMMDR